MRRTALCATMALLILGAFSTSALADSGDQTTVTIDAHVPPVIPGSLDFVNVKVGATRVVKGHKRGYIEPLICPPSALVPIQGDFKFANASPFHTDTYIHCG